VLALMLLAGDHRVVHFLHEAVQLTSTGAEVLVCELTVLADFLADQFLNVFHVPELLVTGQSIAERVPVKEMSDESQPSSQVFVENFIGQVLEIFNSASSLLDGFLKDSVSVNKLLISLF
jgi:hypothetical protein